MILRHLLSVVLLITLVAPFQTHAIQAITFDNSDAVNAGTGTFITAGSNRILIAFVKNSSSTDQPPSSVTYGTGTMVFIAKVQAASSIWMYSYYLIAPDSGSNTFTVNGAGTYKYYLESLNGASQTAQPDASATANPSTSSTHILGSVTVAATGSWVVALGFVSGAVPTSVASPFSFRGSAVANSQLSDTAGTVSAGSQTADYTYDAASTARSITLISVAPAASVVGSGFGILTWFGWF